MTFDLIRRVTGYLALVGAACYWVYLFTASAPQIRKGTRCRSLAVKVVLIELAAVLITAAFVVEVHFLATEWWQVLASVALVIPTSWLLRRVYRKLVAAPKHSLRFSTQRPERFSRRSGHRLGR